MSSVENRCNEAIALLDPLVEKGWRVSASANRESVVLAWPFLGIKFVPVDGILAAPDPAQYARDYAVEGEGS